MLFLNAGGKFVHKADSGISYKPGKVGPALCDFDGDGHLDLFVPQTDGKCKLFRNDGDRQVHRRDRDGRRPGEADPRRGVRGVGRLRQRRQAGPARLLPPRRRTATSRTTATARSPTRRPTLGLTQKVFNSQAAAFADLNGDGQLDLILNNEGQESACSSACAAAGERQDAVVALNGTATLNGGKVVVKDAAGKAVACCCVTGGDGRGGQARAGAAVRAGPGAYKFEFVGPDGKAVTKDVTVAAAPMSVRDAVRADDAITIA